VGEGLRDGDGDGDGGADELNVPAVLGLSDALGWDTCKDAPYKSL
jgi:hypothetical protein